MRSAAVILTQHRRSCRPVALRHGRTPPRPIVAMRCNLRRDSCNEARGDARVLPRPNSACVRSARRRCRPDVLIPRGFLPLVVH
jgi:hypothetical protein